MDVHTSSAATDECFDGIPDGFGRPPQGSGSERERERVRETMEHGSERKEVGDEAGRRRACEIFIMVSSEFCCPEEAFNWDSYNVVNYKSINYITIMIQNLYLARYVLKPLCQ